ncbi:MAG: tRNA (adenosine(37)-N6)-threonylcarbamoyltransferase complex ATPase subunit type 1 TsaE [Candidatus Cloacimonetes bacterium]|nr:tRNA (adenosine(37)-N6)-threonylcarbamoyltransferase complex ATPase subunit type 1 TsaE [Candidatus Cloacimonadota bacterium]
MNRIIELKTEQDTIDLAKEFAGKAKQGDIFALYGELGTGKTFFTQHLCKFLGVDENVSSPSYVLMNEYVGDFHIAHLDFYRLGGVEEVFELGLHDIFESGITIIEWPEIGEEILPENTIRLKFSFDGNNREVKVI